MQKNIQSLLAEQMHTLYGPKAPESIERLQRLIESYRPVLPKKKSGWTEKDVVLITYADMVREEGERPLKTLGSFLDAWLSSIVNTVHILPFSPYSSDDGFSVIDYRAVNSDFGEWQDIEKIGKSFNLMFDLVLNHVSSQSQWAKLYKQRNDKYKNFFIEVNPDTDLSIVTRPRNLPLLTPVETSEGTKHLWTTFSEDQLDLNFANPDVLLEMLEILLFYISKGMRIIRLDAIAYLWKQIGTCCIHLNETHQVVKLIRNVLEQAAPGVILLTETNVPHEENMSYLGNGSDEAHMVYQFTLPPLMLYSIIHEDATRLTDWAKDVRLPGPDTTFFNFTASHDGIGVRPLEGIIPQSQIKELSDEIKRRGGLVSVRTDDCGNESPYELNVTYFSAMKKPEETDDTMAILRFLASQAIMLSLQGIPAFYFHSQFATPNAIDWVRKTGMNRSINRRKYTLDEMHKLLREPDSTTSTVYQAMAHMIRVRTSEPCFHPDIEQTVFSIHPKLFSIRRGGILAITNLSSKHLTIDLSKFVTKNAFDILSESGVKNSSVEFKPYSSRWIKGALT